MVLIEMKYLKIQRTYKVFVSRIHLSYAMFYIHVMEYYFDEYIFMCLNVSMSLNVTFKKCVSSTLQSTFPK